MKMTATAGRLLTTSVAVLGALAAAFLTASAPPAAAQDAAHMSISPAGQAAPRDVRLGLGKSLVVDLPRDAKDVLVSNPLVADAVMRTARRAYLIGIEVGETNVFFFDAAGRQIAVLEVHVQRDLAGLSSQIRQLLPGSAVRVEAVNDNVVLTGSVRTPSDAVNAASIAARFVGDPERVLNMISSEDSEQVHLKVTVAEMRRNVLKQLGVNIRAMIDGGTQLAVSTQTPFALGRVISDTIIEGSFGNLASGDQLTLILRAMEERGLMRTLAEPTLSAISGESAEFLSGGEFPVIVGTDRDTGAPIIEFKEFGVGLAFTPVVHSGGRMTLKVRTEVSEVTQENAVVLNNLAVPGINTRRADTTVELPSGGSLVLAGLLQQNTRQAITGLPGLKDIPVLGALFRSRDYQSNETELVVIATPYLVKPTAPSQLTRPDRNFAPANDISAVLLGRLNRIYGVAGSAPQGPYHGPVGFIVE